MTPQRDVVTPVAIIDDHRMVCEGLCVLLHAYPEMEVVGAFASVDEILAVRFSTPPRVVLAAFTSGAAVARDLREVLDAFPGAAVVVLSGSESDAPVFEAIRAGAKGYLFKHASLEDLRNAILTVAAGGIYSSPELSPVFLENIQRGNDRRPDVLGRLTPRETEVMRLVSQGKSSKEIAQMLQLEVETIRSYRKNLMRQQPRRNSGVPSGI